MKQILIFSALILFLFNLSNLQAQKLGELVECNPYGDSRLAQLKVKLFLTMEDYATDRTTVGAFNETVESIRPVSDIETCTQLNAIIQANTKYKAADTHTGPDRCRYMYKTNNFYYIFWGRKPEFDDRPHMGPNTLFIVVSKDFHHVHEFYY